MAILRNINRLTEGAEGRPGNNCVGAGQPLPGAGANAPLTGAGAFAREEGVACP